MNILNIYKNKQQKNAIIFIMARCLGLFLQILTLPILANRLGVSGLGVISYAQVFSGFFGAVVDFGFNVTGTKEIVARRKNSNSLRLLFWSIQCVRFYILVGVTILILLTYSFHDINEWLIISLGFGLIFGMFLTPQWIYQGLEEIPIYVALILIPRILAILYLYFLIDKNAEIFHYAFVIFLAEFFIGILTFSYAIFRFVPGNILVSKKIMLKIYKPALENWQSTLSSSILLLAYPTIIKDMLGYYYLGIFSAVDKLIRSVHSLIWPIAQAYYPKICILYSLRNEDGASKTAFKYSFFLTVIAVVGVMVLILFSNYLILNLYSSDFLESSLSLKWMAPFLVFAAMNNSLCYFYYYPQGNFSIVKRISIICFFVSGISFFIFVKYLKLHGAFLSIVSSEFLIVTFLIINEKSLISKIIKK